MAHPISYGGPQWSTCSFVFPITEIPASNFSFVSGYDSLLTKAPGSSFFFFWYKSQWPSGWSRPIWSLKVGPTCIMHHGQPDDLDLDFSELLIWVEPTNPSYKRRIFKIPNVEDVCPLIYPTNIGWEVQGARKMFFSVFLSYPFFFAKRGEDIFTFQRC